MTFFPLALHIDLPNIQDVGNRNEHLRDLKRGAIKWWMVRKGQDDTNPSFVGTSEATAHPRYTPQQRQRYNSTTKGSALRTLAFVRDTVLPCQHVRAVFTRRYMQSSSHFLVHVQIIVKSDTRRRISTCHSIPQLHLMMLPPPFQLATRPRIQDNHVAKKKCVPLGCLRHIIPNYVRLETYKHYYEKQSNSPTQGQPTQE